VEKANMSLRRERSPAPAASLVLTYLSALANFIGLYLSFV
jgi:hypothetical protein